MIKFITQKKFIKELKNLFNVWRVSITASLRRWISPGLSVFLSILISWDFPVSVSLTINDSSSRPNALENERAFCAPLKKALRVSCFILVSEICYPLYANPSSFSRQLMYSSSWLLVSLRSLISLAMFEKVLCISLMSLFFSASKFACAAFHSSKSFCKRFYIIRCLLTLGQLVFKHVKCEFFYPKKPHYLCDTEILRLQLFFQIDYVYIGVHPCHFWWQKHGLVLTCQPGQGT